MNTPGRQKASLCEEDCNTRCNATISLPCHNTFKWCNKNNKNKNKTIEKLQETDELNLKWLHFWSQRMKFQIQFELQPFRHRDWQYTRKLHDQLLCNSNEIQNLVFFNFVNVVDSELTLFDTFLVTFCNSFPMCCSLLWVTYECCLWIWQMSYVQQQQLCYTYTLQLLMICLLKYHNVYTAVSIFDVPHGCYIHVVPSFKTSHSSLETESRHLIFSLWLISCFPSDMIYRDKFNFYELSK